MENLIQKIVDYLRGSILLDPTMDIPLDCSLTDVGVLDSFGVVDLLTFLECEFGLTIPDEDITKQKMGSIRKMAAYIQTHRREAA